MLEQIYVEIGNVCNLNCSFCQGTTKKPRQMSCKEFEIICDKIKHHTKFIYLHVMGEPLLHPQLDSILKIAKLHELKVCITTNGTLLDKKSEILLQNNTCLHKISISLHAQEGNGIEELDEYLKNVAEFAKNAAENGIFVVFRLWNRDSTEGFGKNLKNEEIEATLKSYFKEEWSSKGKGFRLSKNVFLEYDGVFTWPSQSGAEKELDGFCHAMSKQIAVLADGTVVPCCLDSNGEIELGNLFCQSLDEILESPKAKAITNGFKQGKIVEPLCQKCTFRRRFKTRNN